MQRREECLKEIRLGIVWLVILLHPASWSELLVLLVDS